MRNTIVDIGKKTMLMRKRKSNATSAINKNLIDLADPNTFRCFQAEGPAEEQADATGSMAF